MCNLATVILQKLGTSVIRVLKSSVINMEGGDRICYDYCKNNSILFCCLCGSYIIKPTVINCGHLFCKSCIDRRVFRGKRECPDCQIEIVKRIQIFRGDDLLDSIVAALGPEAQEQRKAEMRKREEEDSKPLPSKRSKKARLSSRSAGPALQ